MSEKILCWNRKNQKCLNCENKSYSRGSLRKRQYKNNLREVILHIIILKSNWYTIFNVMLSIQAEVLDVFNSHHNSSYKDTISWWHPKSSLCEIHYQKRYIVDGLIGLWWGDIDKSADIHAGITQDLEKETSFASWGRYYQHLLQRIVWSPPENVITFFCYFEKHLQYFADDFWLMNFTRCHSCIHTHSVMHKLLFLSFPHSQIQSSILSLYSMQMATRSRS